MNVRILLLAVVWVLPLCVRADIEYITFHNQGSAQHWVAMKFKSGGQWYNVASGYKTMNPGEVWSHAWWNGASVYGYQAGWQFEAGGTVYDLGAIYGNTPGENRHVYFGDGGPAGSVTNYYCVYAIPAWTNQCAIETARFGLVTETGQEWGVSVKLPPGAYTTGFSWTNNIGTNGASTCVDIFYGDLDSHECAGAPGTAHGTRYGQDTAPGGSSGSGSGGTPGPNTGWGSGQYAGGTTNLVTQKDIFTSSDSILKGLGELGKALKEAIEANGLKALTNAAAAGDQFKASTNVDLSAKDPTAAGIAADAETTTTRGNFDSMNTGTNFSVWSEGGSAPAALSFEFAGSTINADPDAWIPGITGVIKAAWTLIIVAGFAFFSGKLLFDASRTYAQAQTGGVPDLDASVLGTGGNALGVGMALVVPAALIAIWVIAFTGIFGYLLSKSGLVAAAVSGFSLGGNQVAMYLFTKTFPINLALSLLLTRIMLQFTAAKVVFVAASASKFLFGK